jgi:hypothetical protein
LLGAELETTMPLNIYVGTLTRYYAGDWETVIQKQAREAGTGPSASPPEAGDAIRDPSEIRPIVVEWRQGIAAALKESITDPFDWDESSDAPYATDQLTKDALWALRLWAAYTEHPDLSRPTGPVADAAADPAFLRSNSPESTSAYHQVVRDIEIWLPWSFAFTFLAETPAGGAKVGMGSVPSLRSQLAELNEKTWRASLETSLAGWRKEGAPAGAPLEVAAKHAFAVLYPLAALAEKRRLLLKLEE